MQPLVVVTSAHSLAGLERYRLAWQVCNANESKVAQFAMLSGPAEYWSASQQLKSAINSSLDAANTLFSRKYRAAALSALSSLPGRHSVHFDSYFILYSFVFFHSNSPYFYFLSSFLYSFPLASLLSFLPSPSIVSFVIFLFFPLLRFLSHFISLFYFSSFHYHSHLHSDWCQFSAKRTNTKSTRWHQTPAKVDTARPQHGLFTFLATGVSTVRNHFQFFRITWLAQSYSQAWLTLSVVLEVYRT